MGRRGKWKVVHGESMAHRLSKSRQFRKFDRLEQALIFSIVVIVSFFSVAGIYYQGIVVPQANFNNGCPLNYVLYRSSCVPDPFTTIWNGQVKNAPATPAVAFDFADYPEASTQSSNFSSSALSLTAGEVVFVSVHAKTNACVNAQVVISSVPAFSFSRVFPTTCSFSISNNVQLFDGRVPSTGSYNVTVFVQDNTCGNGRNACFVWSAAGFSNVVSIGQSVNAYGTSGSSSLSVSEFFAAGDGLFADAYGLESGTNSCGQTISVTGTEFGPACQGFDNGAFIPQTWGEYSDGSFSAINSVNATFVASEGLTFQAVHLIGARGPCDQSYRCVNSYVDSSGNFVLAPNSTTSAAVLTTSQIDLSNCAAKACSFSVNGALPAGSNTQNGMVNAWFLTINGTLPTQPGWNPLDDNSVSLVVLQFVTGSTTAHYYVFVQRQEGQAISPGTFNPGVSNCSFASTLFMCAGVPQIPSGANLVNLQSLTLNFTGATNPNSPGTTGQSYGCFGTFSNSGVGTDNCFFGGYSSTTIRYTGQLFNQTLLPWLNVQQKYYLGYWAFRGTNAWKYLSSVGSNQPIISVYTNPTNGVSPTQDSGGFFGWLKDSMVGGVTIFLQATGLMALFGAVAQVVNSTTNDFITGFIYVITILIKGYQVFFNFVGNALGLGNLGDALVNFFAFLFTSIVQLLNAIYLFFAAIANLLIGGYFAFVIGVLNLFPVLVAFALLIWGLIFNGTFGVDAILFLMFAYWTMETVEHGLKGFFGVVMLYAFIITFPFDAAWRVFDMATRGIHRSKQTADPIG